MNRELRQPPAEVVVEEVPLVPGLELAAREGRRLELVLRGLGEEPVVRVGQVRGSHGASTPIVVPARIRCATASRLPARSQVVVLATFRTKFNEPRNARCTFNVPLCLAMQAHEPSKDATYKLTIRDVTGVTLACLSDIARRCVRASMHGFVARLAKVACSEFCVHLHQVALSMRTLLRLVFERLVFLWGVCAEQILRWRRLQWLRRWLRR